MDRWHVTLKKNKTHSSYSTSSGIGDKSFHLSNSCKITENLDKMWSNLWFQKMAPNIFRKTHEDLFLQVLPKKGLHDLWPLWRNFVGKVPQNVTGKFWQISFAPPKICLLLNRCTSTDFQTKTGWCSDTKETESHVYQLNHGLQLRS